MSCLKELHDKDISGPGKDPEDTSTINSRYELSWIWLVSHFGNCNLDMDEQEFNDSMRIEWAKARARMMRWKEELLLIQEEMPVRHVIAYHRRKAGWWRDRGVLQSEGDATVLSGLSGYANKQASICTQMAERCALYWLPHLSKKGLMPEWASQYVGQVGLHADDLEEEGTDDEDEEDLEEEDRMDIE
jgi:hypothetical protein